MDWLAEIFTSTGLGSIVGLAGGLVSKHSEYKIKKIELGYELKRAHLAIEEAKLEHEHALAMADKQVERAQVEGSLKVESEEVQAFTESIKNADKFTGILRYVRPAITAYLLLASTMLFGVVWVRVGGLDAFLPMELNALLRDMINAAIFLTVTCVSWWFASRGGNLTK